MIKYLTNKLRTQSINEENSNNEKVSSLSGSPFSQKKPGKTAFHVTGKKFPHCPPLMWHFSAFACFRKAKWEVFLVWILETRKINHQTETTAWCVSERAIKWHNRLVVCVRDGGKSALSRLFPPFLSPNETFFSPSMTLKWKHWSFLRLSDDDSASLFFLNGKLEGYKWKSNKKGEGQEENFFSSYWLTFSPNSLVLLGALVVSRFNCRCN